MQSLEFLKYPDKSKSDARNKPEGSKTALANASIFTSQLLELMTWTLLLPFMARLGTTSVTILDVHICFYQGVGRRAILAPNSGSRLPTGGYSCGHYGHPILLCLPASTLHRTLWPDEPREWCYYSARNTAGLSCNFFYCPWNRNRIQGSLEYITYTLRTFSF